MVTYELWVDGEKGKRKRLIAGYGEEAMFAFLAHVGFSGLVYASTGGDVTTFFI